MRRLVSLLGLLWLSACMVGPDYRRPVVNVPDAYTYEVKAAQDTANTVWWRQFQDPVLDDLIAEALRNNKSIKIAAANVEQAAAALTQARAPLFPQAGYGAAAGQQKFSEGEAAASGLVPNPVTRYQVLAGASWELDLWGRIRRLSEAARANLMASQEARRGVVLSLVASVASGYLQLRGFDEQLEIAQRNLLAYGDSVRLFELKFRYGQVSRMNVEQARTQYETAAATIPQLETQIVQTENALSILLGRNPGSIPRGKSIRDLTLPAVPEGIPSQVLENRPDIAQSEQNLIAANAQIGAAKALYFPTVSLTGNLGVSSNDLTNLFKGPSRVWSYSGSITGPIFQGGAISGLVRQTRAAEQAALVGYESVIQSAFADVENALESRTKLGERLDAQGRLVKAAQEYERLAQLLFDGGYAPYATVLQAQQQLFPAELNWVQTRAELCASLVAIYKAMGGGWVAEADKLTADSTPERGN